MTASVSILFDIFVAPSVASRTFTFTFTFTSVLASLLFRPEISLSLSLLFPEKKTREFPSAEYRGQPTIFNEPRPRPCAMIYVDDTASDERRAGADAPATTPQPALISEPARLAVP